MPSKNILAEARRAPSAVLLTFSISLVAALPLVAQSSSSPSAATAPAPSGRADEINVLKQLLELASASNPSIAASRSRVAAARARVGPAAAWPDPMLMAGIQNLPLGRMDNTGDASMGASSLPDRMTMKMLGVGQTIPFPGKPGLRRRIAEREAEAALADLETVSLEVARDVKKNYYELAFIDLALAIANRNQALLADVIRVAEARYGSGVGGEQEALKAHVDAARLGERASELLEQRRARLAEVNAVVDRASTTEVGATEIPDRIRDAAVVRDPARIRFVSQSLGSRTANSPLPPLEVLQSRAVRSNPSLRRKEAMIAAQSARVELARKASRPDIDVSLQYGQRDQRPDMISAVVSIPIPVHRRSRQDQELAEARADLAAMQGEARAEANKVRSDVARAVTEVERSRTRLALYTRGILPQGQAAVTASLASYQSGKGDLLSVLDNQATLFDYETAYYRSLTDFAQAVADLEQIIAAEVLP